MLHEINFKIFSLKLKDFWSCENRAKTQPLLIILFLFKRKTLIQEKIELKLNPFSTKVLVK